MALLTCLNGYHFRFRAQQHQKIKSNADDGVVVVVVVVLFFNERYASISCFFRCVFMLLYFFSRVFIDNQFVGLFYRL